MPRRNPYGWTFCPIASFTPALVPVEPAGQSCKTLSLLESGYCAAFFAVVFLAAAFLAGAFLAAAFLAAGFLPAALVAGASESVAFVAAGAAFFSATVTMMWASLRW